MLIDDEPALLEVLKPFIERSGEMSVHTAQSAAEALRILPEKSFDAIVVDYDMPEINGIEFLKILRSKGDTTPVIIFTGVGHERTAIEAINYGANFFLQKAEDPKMQFHQLCDMIRTSVESKFIGRNLGTTRQVISDMIDFSLDPSFAIDRDGKVVAWNSSMEQLTGTPASDVLGKSDYLYTVPLFGTQRKMLVNLIFEPDEEIKRYGYKIISRIAKGPIIAVTDGIKKDGSKWTVWSKAMPVYDMQGNFIAVVGIVLDVTSSFKDIKVPDELPVAGPQAAGEQTTEPASTKVSKPAGLIGQILNKSSAKALSLYKEGVALYKDEKNYADALVAFNKAREIDDTFPNLWNDMGLCYRETGDRKSELKSLSRAVELAPDNPEFLFNLGETLEMIGILNMSNKYLDSAIQTFKMVTSKMPNNADAWNNIGVCYKEMGQIEESKFYFDRARDLHISKKHKPIKPKRDV